MGIIAGGVLLDVVLSGIGAPPIDHHPNKRMPQTTTDPGVAPRAEPLVAEVVDTLEGRQCTIYPDNVDDAALVTTWISADERGFVSLADMR